MQLGEILNKRHNLYRDTASKTSGNNSIELPKEIDDLIDNKMYRNRYKRLIRDGHLADLLELAALAVTKTKPSHWFARICSVRRWDGTLAWLRKAREVAQNAAEVARRLALRSDQLKAVYKACWHLNSSVISKAVLADEIVTAKGGNRLRLFNYLCWKA